MSVPPPEIEGFNTSPFPGAPRKVKVYANGLGVFRLFVHVPQHPHPPGDKREVYWHAEVQDWGSALSLAMNPFLDPNEGWTPTLGHWHFDEASLVIERTHVQWFRLDTRENEKPTGNRNPMENPLQNNHIQFFASSANYVATQDPVVIVYRRQVPAGESYVLFTRQVKTGKYLTKEICVSGGVSAEDAFASATSNDVFLPSSSRWVASTAEDFVEVHKSASELVATFTKDGRPVFYKTSPPPLFDTQDSSAPNYQTYYDSANRCYRTYTSLRGQLHRFDSSSLYTSPPEPDMWRLVYNPAQEKVEIGHYILVATNGGDCSNPPKMWNRWVSPSKWQQGLAMSYGPLKRNVVDWFRRDPRQPESGKEALPPTDKWSTAEPIVVEGPQKNADEKEEIVVTDVSKWVDSTVWAQRVEGPVGPEIRFLIARRFNQAVGVKYLTCPNPKDTLDEMGEVVRLSSEPALQFDPTWDTNVVREGVPQDYNPGEDWALVGRLYGEKPYVRELQKRAFQMTERIFALPKQIKHTIDKEEKMASAKSHTTENQLTGSGPSLKDVVKSDAEDIAYRTVAAQLSKIASKAIASVVKRAGVGRTGVAAVAKFLESDTGRGFVSAFAGYGVLFYSKDLGDERYNRLAKELRVGGAALGLNKALDLVAEEFAPSILQALALLPNGKKADKIRLEAAPPSRAKAPEVEVDEETEDAEVKDALHLPKKAAKAP